MARRDTRRPGVSVPGLSDTALSGARPLAEAGSVAAQNWLRDNQAAMDAWNAHVEQNGLPLDAFRQF